MLGPFCQMSSHLHTWHFLFPGSWSARAPHHSAPPNRGLQLGLSWSPGLCRTHGDLGHAKSTFKDASSKPHHENCVQVIPSQFVPKYAQTNWSLPKPLPKLPCLSRRYSRSLRSSAWAWALWQCQRWVAQKPAGMPAGEHSLVISVKGCQK